MMPLTPTEDIRAARHKLAARFNNDLDRIVADLRRQETEADADFVTLPRRPPAQVANQSMHGRDAAGQSVIEQAASPSGDG
jgi:hypothetical protein